VANARREYEPFKRQPLPDAQLGALLDGVFEGLVALRLGRPEDALAQLQSIPLDFPHSLVLTALLVRGDALRALGRLDEAERDYRAVLTRRGPGIFNLAHPLARVGLARTLAASGKTAAAREEYTRILEQWNEADEDLRLVQQVRAETANVGS
jgi:tetratricopeptide (TPR) repeat protein